MGNGQSRNRPLKKNVHWKTAEPPSTPGKPILVSEGGDTPDVVTIRWDKSKTDGGAPILGYLVEHRRTGSPHWVRAFPNLVPNTSLALSGLEPGWRYQFRITAQNIVGKSEASEISEPLTVTLQRNAITAPRFTAELSDVSAIENEKLEFSITVTGTPSPEINWYKDGYEIFSSRRTKICTEGNTSVLIFHECALTDEGEIKCTATNRAGHSVTKSLLRVEAPPKIRLPRNYEDGLIVEAGDRIRLKVGIAGKPAPDVSWSHNGEIIYPNDKIEIVTTDINTSLNMPSALREHRGEYSVRATNKLGEDNGSILITITAKPSPPTNLKPRISSGTSLNLSWNAPDDDGGCKIGTYTVEYFRVGWNVWLKGATTRLLQANLSDLIEGSEYRFRVKAENPYGISEPSEESQAIFIPGQKLDHVESNAHSTLAPEETQSRPARKRSPFRSPDRRTESVERREIGEQAHMARLRINSNSKVNLQLTPELFDSDTIANDLSYGAPDPEKSSTKDSLEKDFSFSSTNDRFKTAVFCEPVKQQSINVNQEQDSRSLLSTNNQKDDIDVHPTSTNFGIDEDDLLVPPPPLSLSAPDLSIQPPQVVLLKRSSSSTELLYEKAMQRFYKAMELDKSGPGSTKEFSPIPKIQHEFSSFDKDDTSLTQEVNETPVKHVYPQESLDEPECLSNFDDDYTESSASESESEAFIARVQQYGEHRNSMRNNDMDTYHPSRLNSPYKTDSDQAAEVLTKPYGLPNPDFIPKPILKRRMSSEDEKPEKPEKTDTNRKIFSKLFDRKPKTPTESLDTVEAVKPVIVQEETIRRESVVSAEKAEKMLRRQSSVEEQKVAIDHYSDLVREKSDWRKTQLPLYLNADDLKKAASIFIPDEGEEQSFTNLNNVEKPPVEVVIETPPDATNTTGNDLRSRPTQRVPKANTKTNRSISRGSLKPIRRSTERIRERSSSKSPQPRIVEKTKDIEVSTTDEQIQNIDIDTKVKSTMTYTTDVVLLIVAFWVYLFKDARLALPIILLLGYRQIKGRLPHWLLRKIE